MSLFLGMDPADSTHLWKEWQLQAYVVMALRRGNYTVAGDQNAGKRSPGLAIASGIQKGEPDLRVYLPGGKLILFEMKTAKGQLSSAQKDYHLRLSNLGFQVYTVFARCPEEARIKVMGILGTLA